MASWLEEAKVKEKEALKEVFGAGGDITAANPLGVAVTTQAPEITQMHRRAVGIDSLFYMYAGGVGKISDYWNEATGILKHGFWAFHSKRAFNNGFFLLRAKLNTATNTGQLFGVESGSSYQMLSVLFSVKEIGGVPKAYIRVGAAGAIGAWGTFYITPLLPADYDTALHYYTIKVNRNNVLFWIDGSLRAVFLLGIQEYRAYTPENVPPYLLVSTLSPNTAGCYFVGMEGPDYMEWVVDTNSLIAADGEPITPLMIPAYKENTDTKWTGLATAGALQTSHPVPVWGYTTKSLYFMADGAGTLTVQIYAGGGWRDIATPVVAANTLVVYNLDYETPIARCLYDPSNNDTITLAEWCLS